ncbi:MAG TPA: TRAP transporter small permease [Casimicrobiaceae bacterium]|nr:TRAP transporter small permease [Casimicrobiaceae bacterium]
MDRLTALLRFVLFVLIVALVATVSIGVVWRYALGSSLYWATEVPNFLFVWLVFLGAVVAYREKKHIAFTAILDRLSARGWRAPELAVHAIVLAFALFLLVTGAMVVNQTLDSPSEALKLPLGYLYSVLPFASLMIAFDAIGAIVGVVHGRGRRQTP